MKFNLLEVDLSNGKSRTVEVIPGRLHIQHHSQFGGSLQDVLVGKVRVDHAEAAVFDGDLLMRCFKGIHQHISRSPASGVSGHSPTKPIAQLNNLNSLFTRYPLKPLVSGVTVAVNLCILTIRLSQVRCSYENPSVERELEMTNLQEFVSKS